MKHHATLLLLLLFVSPGFIPGQTASSDTATRMAGIQTQFQTAYDRDVAKPHLTALTDLDAKYLVAVNRVLDAATQAGNLEEALKLREETERVTKKQPLSPADLDSLPEGLKELRSAYRSALERINQERDQKAQPYFDHYDKLLEALQMELTKERQIDEAMKVRKVREELSRQRTQNPDKQAAPSAPPPKGTQLFDGRSLTGWRIEGDKKAFTVVGGLLKANGQKASLMCTEGPWKSFELNLKVMTELQGNSGVWIHTPKNPRDSSNPGLEVQIYNGPDAQKTGSIYSIQPQTRLLVRDGQWFDLKIIVQDKTIRVFVNGTRVNEWTQPSGWRPPPNVPTAELGSGTIGLQSNGGVTWFKDIFIRPL